MKKPLLLILSLSICLGAVWMAKKSTSPQSPPGLVQPPPYQQFKVPGWPKRPETAPVMTREQAKNAITADSCRESVTRLCSDEWEGRMTGHAGNVKAAAWIEGKFKSWGLQTQYQQFPWTAGVNPGPRNERGDAFSKNIIGILPGVGGRDIIVGAHMDHLGYGPRASRWGAGKIHPGADDNATGTTLVLEVAQAMYRMGYRPKHTIIFIAFSGEEMGLIGSYYYCKNPIRPLSQLSFMFNTDMIGRMSGKTSMSVGGSTKLNPFMQKLNQSHPIKMSASGGGGGGSDHAPFYEKGIPCCCFHSGMHGDYHTPTDTADRIDYEGMHKVVRYVFELVLDFDLTERYDNDKR